MGPPVVTVRAPDGAPLARVAIAGGRARVDPPEAAAHPLVAAVAAEMERTSGRRRPRPSC